VRLATWLPLRLGGYFGCFASDRARTEGDLVGPSTNDAKAGDDDMPPNTNGASPPAVAIVAPALTAASPLLGVCEALDARGARVDRLVAQGEDELSALVGTAARWLFDRLPAPRAPSAAQGGGGGGRRPDPQDDDDAAAKAGTEDEWTVPWRLLDTPTASTHTAVFSVPRGCEALLARYPYSCRGGAFEVEPHADGAVRATFVSPVPGDTAAAIAQRIRSRFDDPSYAAVDADGAGGCPVS